MSALSPRSLMSLISCASFIRWHSACTIMLFVKCPINKRALGVSVVVDPDDRFVLIIIMPSSFPAPPQSSYILDFSFKPLQHMLGVRMNSYVNTSLNCLRLKLISNTPLSCHMKIPFSLNWPISQSSQNGSLQYKEFHDIPLPGGYSNISSPLVVVSS